MTDTTELSREQRCFGCPNALQGVEKAGPVCYRKARIGVSYVRRRFQLCSEIEICPRPARIARLMKHLKDQNREAA